MNGPKRLYRVESNAKLTGVCGGIAEYFNFDPNIIRLLWVVLSFPTCGAGIILYLVASLLLPKKSEVYPGY